MQDQQLQSDLAYIACNLFFFPTTQKQLEEAGMTLGRSFMLLDDVMKRIDLIPGENGDTLKEKFQAVRNPRNPNIEVLRTISNILCGPELKLPNNIQPADAANFRFCPVVNVDAERFFSEYKESCQTKIIVSQRTIFLKYCLQTASTVDLLMYSLQHC